ncbi:MAG: tRNA uridine(34) 5-carboxymethylaminomethyl modification radical SAM/GNAT enzyme Elp3 [Chloroflexota bacterium]
MKRIIPHEEIPNDVLAHSEAWKKKRSDFDPAAYSAEVYAIFQAILQVPDSEWNGQNSLNRILVRFPRDGKGLYSKAQLIAGYRHLVAEGDMDPDPQIMRRIRMKPMRTASGVAPVTVLTAPAGCPGKCIFCPDDWRMPKSYIYDEPGCQRAERDGFDPFRQTLGRIRSFESIGHDASKVELLILGGTWSAYSKDYREWFVRRCLDAMNGANGQDYTPVESLSATQHHNSRSSHRNVGLVIETRPDWITPDEVIHLRQLGVTKIQIGVQSLDDQILDLNKRGHNVESVRQALGLLRTAGFKLQLHWMPNLFGATLDSDHRDFARFYEDPAIRPDELKIYPCSLIKDTELYTHWENGEYQPYTEDELVELLVNVKPTIPPYTRVNRLFRDIPAHHIEAGVRISNLREVVHAELLKKGQRCGCIRCREVKRRQVSTEELTLQVHAYETDLTQEYFLEFVTNEKSPHPGLIAGFLRLSLPLRPGVGSRAFIDEIAESAMIREVHVYGPALSLGLTSNGQAQHAGLGTQLIEAARKISREAGFEQISVIAAIGTREYYMARGFEPGTLYMTGRL